MKSKGRQTFLFYRDWYDTICKLDDGTALEVCKAIMSVAFGEEPRELSNIAEAMMLLIRPQIERDIDKWNEVRAKRQEVGRLGGLAKATNCYQLLPNDSKSKQNLANVADNVDVDVNVENNIVLYEERKDTDVSLIKKEKRFVKPTIEEIQVYIQEKGYTFDAEAFFAYYESNGWKVGRNPMKNWKMACTTWSKNRNNNNNNYGRETITEKMQRTAKNATEFKQRIDANIGKEADMGSGDSDKVW